MSEPTEAKLIYLRQGHPREAPELVVEPGGGIPAAVYVLRPSQLANLAIDATRIALSGWAHSAWAEMWARKFDYPERI